MAIDPSSGDIVLFDLCVGPSLTQRAFLASPASSHFVPSDMGNGFVHHAFRDCRVGNKSFVGRLTFRGERFWSCSFQFVDPELDDSEQRRRAAHDAWLESFLGPPHEVDEAHYFKAYRFPWGTVDSSYDPRSDSSSIGVRASTSPSGGP